MAVNALTTQDMCMAVNTLTMQRHKAVNIKKIQDKHSCDYFLQHKTDTTVNSLTVCNRQYYDYPNNTRKT